ncbi:MAG: MotA/TolQ/ExbB proton channel family protein [bacterium JZ-2024 1]
MNIVWNFIQAGGWVNYILLAISIVGVAIIIHRFYHLTRATTNERKLLDKAKSFWVQGNATAMELLFEETPGPVSRILASAFQLRNLGREEILEGVKETAITEIQRMNWGLPVLSTLVSVSLLLGLLGTILGLMRIYNVIAGGRIGDPEALAGGIALALTTTAFGLMIAIPFLIFHSILVQKVEGLTAAMERSLHEMLNYIKLEEKISEKKVQPWGS